MKGRLRGFAWLVIVFTVAAGGLGILRMVAVASSTICRGVDCIAWAPDRQVAVQTSSLTDRCFYLGSPTGVGIFKNRSLGGILRSLLGFEYILLGTEFLFIEPSRRSEPIIVIDANHYGVEFPPEAFCNRGATSLTLDAKTKRIQVQGCAPAFTERSGGQAECRVDDRGGRQAKTEAAGRLP